MARQAHADVPVSANGDEAADIGDGEAFAQVRLEERFACVG
jgi:hypothetical protein